MSGNHSFSDDDRQPSETPEEGEISNPDHYSPSGYRRSRTSQFNNDSPSKSLREEDMPIPSIEVDIGDSEPSFGMFISPEPHERRRGHSTPISIPDTPQSHHHSKQHDVQVIDDDCMIVNVEECSLEAQNKWSKSKSKPNVILLDPIIKTEPGIEPPRTPNILEIQKRLISQHVAAQKRKSGASTMFGFTRPKDVSPIPRTKPKPRRGSNYQQKSLDNIVDVKVEFETLMRRGEDDSGWMGPQDDEGGESEELENLKRLKRSFEKRQGAGSLTEVETIEFMKVKHQIQLQRRRRETADRLNKKESMFISSDDEEDDEAERRLNQPVYNQAAPQEEVAQDPNSKGGKKSTKGRGRKVAKTAREVQEQRREKQREKERKKRARANSKRDPKGKGSKKTGKAAGPKQQHKSRMKMGLDDGAATLTSLLHNLVHNDFIADRQAQRELPVAPEIHATRKDQALLALLASVPDDYDTHRAKIENSDLAKASKSFGFGRVKFEKGRWKLKGMRSHL
jgi:hypothetical protein